jgi:hypothetical protein
MTQFTDLFNPETLFSKANPFLKAAEKTHRRIFETFKRFEALYAGDSFMDKISTQQDLLTEFGKRTATWAGDLQEVAVDLQNNVSEAANELVSPITAKAPAAKAKKPAARKAAVKKAKAA